VTRTYVCSVCGREHEGPPLAYDFPPIPASVGAAVARDEVGRRTRRTDDQFFLDGERFWVKGLLELPVVDAAKPLLFGVWVEVEADVLEAIARAWDTADPEQTRFAGTFDTIVWPYRNALGLPVGLDYRSREKRPQVVVLDAVHELGREQRDGITLDRVRELAASIEHMEEDVARLG
jgi:hypothetical protein